ncbi:MAG: hypothetical protein ACRDK3_00465 [Actinomycetota bacterium]
MTDQLRFDLGRAPDFAEPLVGWRIWYARPNVIGVESGAGRWMLHSPFDQTPWPSREAMTARCNRRSGFVAVTDQTRLRIHSSPGRDCGCGVYALNDMMTAVQLAESHATHGGRFMAVVLGEVSLWGRVVVAQRGYRAAFAYPGRLWVVPDGFKKSRQSDEGVIEGLEHYGVEFPDRETTPHPIWSLLIGLSNDRDGFDLNRPDAMITAVQEPGRYFVSFAGARARVLDLRAGTLHGEQSANDILSVGTWSPSGYISRAEMRHMVYRVRASRDPWPPSISR